MDLVIQIKNGEPFEHPILLENLQQVYSGITLQSLPNDYAELRRTQKPVLSAYQVYLGHSYVWQNGYVTEQHNVRNMTAEEILAKQNSVKQLWADSGYASWSFDQTTCEFIPPVAYPTDGNDYLWDETLQSWQPLN
jgi:hypothetical protein